MTTEADRRKWIDGVKDRLGLVTIDDISEGLHDAFIGDPGDGPKVFDGLVAAIGWPAGLPDGQWEVISDHVLEFPAGWPPGCRCVLSDGVRVSLGGPCPAHKDVSVATDG